MNYDDQIKYIDLKKAMKLECILIDAWWTKELVMKNERIDSVCQIQKMLRFCTPNGCK
jgi:hypothetical protein